MQGIEAQTSILNATVVQREKFIDLIGSEVRLEHVDIAHWAGLGGVRYIPSDFLDQNRRKVSVAATGEGSENPEGEAEIDVVSC